MDHVVQNEIRALIGTLHCEQGMATQQRTIDTILEQCGQAGRVSVKKMFGEYALYCEDKLVALICDDRLYVKPTPAGRSYVGDVVEAAPYPGAKPSFLIAGETWDDPDWLSELIRLTAADLPVPAPKKSRVKGLSRKDRPFFSGRLDRMHDG